MTGLAANSVTDFTPNTTINRAIQFAILGNVREIIYGVIVVAGENVFIRNDDCHFGSFLDLNGIGEESSVVGNHLGRGKGINDKASWQCDYAIYGCEGSKPIYCKLLKELTNKRTVTNANSVMVIS